MFFGTEILEFSIEMKHMPWGKSIEGRFHSWAEKLSSKASALWKLLSFKKGNWRYPLSLSFFLLFFIVVHLWFDRKDLKTQKLLFIFSDDHLKVGNKKWPSFSAIFVGKTSTTAAFEAAFFSVHLGEWEARPFLTHKSAPVEGWMFLGKAFKLHPPITFLVNLQEMNEIFGPFKSIGKRSLLLGGLCFLLFSFGGAWNLFPAAFWGFRAVMANLQKWATKKMRDLYFFQ